MTPNAIESSGYEAAVRGAREQRILEAMPLVRRIAHWFAAGVPRSVDPADLVSAGVVGLIRAVDLFEPERGASFETFASRHIRGAVLDHLRALDPLPYSTRVKVRRLDQAYLTLQRSLQRTPHLSELAAAAGCTEEEVSELMARASSATLYSLDALAEGGDELPAVCCDAAPDALTRLESGELQEILTRLITALPRPDRMVLSLYYYEGLKMKEIGMVLDVTESRVSQIHARAVTVLRAQVREILEQRG